MEDKKSLIRSIFLYGFSFGLVAGIIEGITLLLQSVTSTPMRVTGDTVHSILNIFYMTIFGNIAFIIFVNLTLGVILYLIAKKFYERFSGYAIVFISGFFMAFNVLASIFTQGYFFSQLAYPLPAFILLRTVFYSVLSSIGAIMSYKYIVSKWGEARSIRNFIIISFLFLIFAPLSLAVNRLYFPFTISIRSLVINVGIMVLFVVMFLLLRAFYKSLCNKYERIFLLKNPVIPVFIVVLISIPLIANMPIFKDLNIKPMVSRDKPNVLLISIDTLRADALSCYGNDRTNTVNLDSLAKGGVRFANAYSQSPWTLPSIGSFMTSLYPTTSGLNRPLKRLDSNRETIAEAFRKAGYNTVAVITNGWNKPNFGMDLGFENYHFQGDAMWILSFNNSIWFKSFAAFYNLFVRNEILHGAMNPNRGNILADIAAKKIGSYRDTNFFMWVHLLDPHDPYAPPREIRQQFSAGYRGRFGVTSGRVNNFRMGVMLEEKEKEQIKNLYLGEVQYVDIQVGKILDALKKNGVYDNTVIIVISDHGEEFWEHNSVTHGHNLYWHQLHVPFLLKWQGAGFGPKVIEERVALLDLKPTLLSLCGIDAGELMQGMDLRGIIYGDDTELKERLDNRELFAEALIYFEEQKGVFDGNFKYVYSEMTHKEELYDLNKDPFEQFNIIAAEDEIAQYYRDTLNDWLLASESIYESLPRDDRSATAELDEETLQQLRGLGYIN